MDSKTGSSSKATHASGSANQESRSTSVPLRFPVISATLAQQLHQGVSQQIRDLQETIRHQQVPSQKVSVSGNKSTVVVSSPGSVVSKPTTSTPVYSSAKAERFTYKVKIINPVKKSEVIVRHLHNFSTKFTSVTELRVKLINEFKEQVPDSIEFNVGYYDGSQQAKMWLVNSDDIKMMYQRVPNGGSVTLWCDGRAEKYPEERLGKRKRDSDCAKRQEQEQDVESTFKELQEKHGQKYDNPRLRLWSRMIVSGIHDDLDNPPIVPAFSLSEPKRRRKESLSETLTGAKENEAHQTTQGPSDVGLSPGKAIELRMKNFEQLRYLQQLYEDQILDEKEYIEQKKSILLSLRKLK